MRMTPYRHSPQPTGVLAYRIAPEAIEVKFVDGRRYLYNYAVTGAAAVERMKQLAKEGEGLSTFISQHVRDKYAERH